MFSFNNKNSLKSFLQAKTKDARLISSAPESTSAQVGQTCKLHALANALLCYPASFEGNTPPTTRKADNKSIYPSLRKQAKELGSVVGEVYNPELILTLAKQNKMVGSRLFEAKTKKEYIQQVINGIEENRPTITYFDVDPKDLRSARVTYQKSHFEHSAVIYGHCSYQGKRLFILAQWGKFYAVPAKEIAKSNFQLAPHQCEEFIKMQANPLFSKKESWQELSLLREALSTHWLIKAIAGDPVPEERLEEMMANIEKGSSNKRQANNEGNLSSFRGKLLEVSPGEEFNQQLREACQTKVDFMKASTLPEHQALLKEWQNAKDHLAVLSFLKQVQITTTIIDKTKIKPLMPSLRALAASLVLLSTVTMAFFAVSPLFCTVIAAVGLLISAYERTLTTKAAKTLSLFFNPATPAESNLKELYILAENHLPMAFN